MHHHLLFHEDGFPSGCKALAPLRGSPLLRRGAATRIPRFIQIEMPVSNTNNRRMILDRSPRDVIKNGPRWNQLRRETRHPQSGFGGGITYCDIWAG